MPLAYICRRRGTHPEQSGDYGRRRIHRDRIARLIARNPSRSSANPHDDALAREFPTD
jgi:hypothetical protein